MEKQTLRKGDVESRVLKFSVRNFDKSRGMVVAILLLKFGKSIRRERESLNFYASVFYTRGFLYLSRFYTLEVKEDLCKAWKSSFGGILLHFAFQPPCFTTLLQFYWRVVSTYSQISLLRYCWRDICLGIIIFSAFCFQFLLNNKQRAR